MTEAVHVDVYDGGGEQCQQLRYQKATDDCIAERLANFRSDTSAEHQWNSAEQRAHRRHQNGTKTQQARLVDRLLSTEPMLTLSDQREIDQHDAVLLDDSNQQND